MLPYAYASGRDMSAVFKWKLDIAVSFETGTLAQNGTDTAYEVGTVLGQIGLGSPSGITSANVTALGTNSAGNGTWSALSAPAGTKPGAWTLVFLDATHIEVTDPDGIVTGHAVAGTPYVGIGPHFTFTAGGTPQAVGDEFTIPVAYATGTLKYVPINFAATDGSQNFAGILAERMLVPAAADMDVLIGKRHVIVIDDSLIWPGGATTTQIAAALAQAAAAGVRTKWGA